MTVFLKALVAGLIAFPLTLPPTTTPSPTDLDDAAIVGIFDAANGWDIATGSLAVARSSRQDVKDFGEMLVNAHTDVRKRGRDLAAKLGVKPTPLADDFPLKVQHLAAMKTLSSLRGAAFDKAFLEHEVAYHQAVIDAVKGTLLPAIKNDELKELVVKVAPAFEAHRLAAQNLLAKTK